MSCPSKSVHGIVGDVRSVSEAACLMPIESLFNVTVCELSTSAFTSTNTVSLPSSDSRRNAYTAESAGLSQVNLAPSKKHGCSPRTLFKRANSDVRFSSLPHANPVFSCTLIRSLASHSTPQVNPKLPLTLASPHSRFLSNDHARPRTAKRSLSCV